MSVTYSNRGVKRGGQFYDLNYRTTVLVPQSIPSLKENFSSPKLGPSNILAYSRVLARTRAYSRVLYSRVLARTRAYSRNVP